MIFSSSYTFTVVYGTNICSIRQVQARKRQKFVCLRGNKRRLRQIKRRIREQIRTLRRKM